MNFSCISRFFTKWLTALVLFLSIARGVYSQEINASVSIDRSRVGSTSLSYLDHFADQLEVYINEYDWISPRFREMERIGMNIQITLLSVDSNYNFEAQIIIQSRRPIYNTTQETPLFFFNDTEWSFQYTPNRTMIHDELQFDALTSLIDFYAYIVLGYDFDSFQKLGGTPYFSEAQNIVSLAQSTSASGWSRTAGNRQSRAQLVSNLLNANHEKFRIALYEYHRLGLDQFVDKPKKARQAVLGALTKIQEAKRTASSNLIFDTFFNAKYREIVSIFEDAAPQVRLEAYNLLSDIDQGHLSVYQKLQ